MHTNHTQPHPHITHAQVDMQLHTPSHTCPHSTCLCTPTHVHTTHRSHSSIHTDTHTQVRIHTAYGQERCLEAAPCGIPTALQEEQGHPRIFTGPGLEQGSPESVWAGVCRLATRDTCEECHILDGDLERDPKKQRCFQRTQMSRGRGTKDELSFRALK